MAFVPFQTVAQALKDEASFMQRKYPSIANRNGTPYLARTLSRVSGTSREDLEITVHVACTA